MGRMKKSKKNMRNCEESWENQGKVGKSVIMMDKVRKNKENQGKLKFC